MNPAAADRLRRDFEKMLEILEEFQIHGLLEIHGDEAPELQAAKTAAIEILQPNLVEVAVHQLSGKALDYVAAHAMFGGNEEFDGTLEGVDCVSDLQGGVYAPTTNEVQLRAVIEEYDVAIWPDQEADGVWFASSDGGAAATISGQSLSEAALRAAGEAYFGTYALVPDELLTDEIRERMSNLRYARPGY